MDPVLTTTSNSQITYVTVDPATCYICGTLLDIATVGAVRLAPQTSGVVVPNPAEDAPNDHYEGVRYADFLVAKWVREAFRHARTRMLEADTWVADVAGIPGPWGDGETEQDALGVLKDVLSDWVYLKIEEHDQDIPVLTGINLNQL